MRPSRIPVIVVLALMWSSSGSAGGVERDREIVVARDGTGDYTTIQAALDGIPAAHNGRVVIFIRKGLYQEKLFLRTKLVTLVGEDRDSTRIVFAELRKTWAAAHGGSDWGSATVNIDTGTSDIILANLTIYNNYGSLYGDHDHQFAIRGFGTRIILLGCNVVADGGDTVSLWDGISGMYYHADCYFEGWVDYVCPRGWCYITDSRFFGHNRASASFWHDGSKNRSQKFVIADSFIDGVSEFPLGRNHLDGQFFFVRCLFSGNMADRPFYRPPSSKREWQWGARHYFWGCHRSGGDFGWFADNIDRADPAPPAYQITALWTFDGQWDPEASMPSLLPYAILPNPKNEAVGIGGTDAVLRWVAARNADRQRVLLTGENGTTQEMICRGAELRPERLEPRMKYTWRVDVVTPRDTIQGKLWCFTTE
jgi:pectinesterase